jgi:hypothetical protein
MGVGMVTVMCVKCPGGPTRMAVADVHVIHSGADAFNNEAHLVRHSAVGDAHGHPPFLQQDRYLFAFP